MNKSIQLSKNINIEINYNKTGLSFKKEDFRVLWHKIMCALLRTQTQLCNGTIENGPTSKIPVCVPIRTQSYKMTDKEIY